MLVWLIPISLFWVAAAIYLGGMRVDVEGGSGFRQVLGLLDSFAGFLVVWGVLRMLFRQVDGVLLQLVLPTVVAVLLLPLITRVGFRLVGVRMRRVEPHDAH